MKNSEGPTKSYILDEIRRIAQGNGGIAPGLKKFASETGINKYDWYGKYWARWNDAIIEAGFAPNQLNVAYGKEELLERYARLALELGRLPSHADLQFKSHHDKNFPSPNTFATLGTKSQLIQQLVGYCQNHDGHENLLEFCNQYSPRRRNSSDDSESQDAEFGFVYLFKSGRFYKLGKSNAAGRRQYELAIQLPEELKTIHVIKTDDPFGIEAYWHKRFDAQRKNGEWFDLWTQDVRAFKRRKFM